MTVTIMDLVAFLSAFGVIGLIAVTLSETKFFHKKEKLDDEMQSKVNAVKLLKSNKIPHGKSFGIVIEEEFDKIQKDKLQKQRKEKLDSIL